jgi:hypothetical protein
MTSVYLYAEYTKSRAISISEDDFNILVTLFPCVLIATADHLFDEEEKVYIANLVASATVELYDDEYKAEQVAKLLFKELLFLSQVNNEWQENFFSVLRDEFEQEDKFALEKMLFEIAEISSKDAVVVNNEIYRIIKFLNI